MANNQYVNKVIYGGNTLIDLTADDVTRASVLSGIKFHLPSGEPTTGTCDYDANTQDANAVAAEILDTKTAYVKGSKVTGTMPNRGSVAGSITTLSGEYTIQQGYHDGSGKVSIAAADQALLIPTNIREGVTVLGVTGTMSSSEGVKATSLTVTPYITAQTIVPADLGDYNSITQVNVAAIAYSEVDNDKGGKTVTIGTVDPAA